MPYNRERLWESGVILIVCVVGAVLIGPILATVFDIHDNPFFVGILVAFVGYGLLSSARRRLSAG